METYFCLIAKCKQTRLKSIADYRPISLIPCAYKTFIGSNRLKLVLPSIIAENQITFVTHRQSLDASLMSNELVDDGSNFNKKGVVIKLDLEKDFDKVNRDFLGQRSWQSKREKGGEGK